MHIRMKKLILVIAIVFSGMLVQAQSETGINWAVTPEKLLIEADDDLISDRTFSRESYYAFDTIQVRVITIRKVFWALNFNKRYFFENNILSVVEITIKRGEIDYSKDNDFSDGGIRANLHDYEVCYKRMLQLLIEKYKEPTYKENLELLLGNKLIEAYNNSDDIEIVSKWKLSKETIKFELSYTYFDDGFIYWYLNYGLNSNILKKRSKEIEVERRKKIEKLNEDNKRKQESKKILKDI